MLRVTDWWCLVEQKASSEGFAAVGGADGSGADPFDCLVVLRRYKEKREFGKSAINTT